MHCLSFSNFVNKGSGMMPLYIRIGLVLMLFWHTTSHAQTDSITLRNDSIHTILLEFHQKLDSLTNELQVDSIRKAAIEARLSEGGDEVALQRNDLLRELSAIEENRQSIQEEIQHAASLHTLATGYPVIGPGTDTLFYIYAKIGSSTPGERAVNITRKIGKLYEDDLVKADSIHIVRAEDNYDVVYKETIIMSVSAADAIWYVEDPKTLAERFSHAIKEAIKSAREDTSLTILLGRIGLIILVLAVAVFLFRLTNKGNVKFLKFLNARRDVWLKTLTYKDYTFLTPEQEIQVILFVSKMFRWVLYAILLYVTLSVVFSIFPFSRQWTFTLLDFVWTPFHGLMLAIWNYLPNVFTILVIYFVMKYIIRFIRFLFLEIEAEKLVLSGFHPDWAMPTFSLVRFLLLAFMFVLIFPYLPGSDSEVFKGVSVFIGVLFSLGSTSAIGNIVAGLVITYMRPFRIGDRIKIGEVTGDLLEKTLLVTRIKTIKNEVITIPNSAVLNGNTINYSVEAREKRLILYTTVTIGYDVPWRNMHEALIEAAQRTEGVLPDPKPFVLQTSLDDFFVSYQINAYTQEANRQALMYSDLHQHIQDVCSEKGIEILSPHYRAARDGNRTTIPADYLPKDYTAPPFNVRMDHPENE